MLTIAAGLDLVDTDSFTMMQIFDRAEVSAIFICVFFFHLLSYVPHIKHYHDTHESGRPHSIP